MGTLVAPVPEVIVGSLGYAPAGGGAVDIADGVIRDLGVVHVTTHVLWGHFSHNSVAVHVPDHEDVIALAHQSTHSPCSPACACGRPQ